MTYQIKAFATLTGVSERTLRYYHEQGLLIPSIAENGYREYTSEDADQLQLILMYRQLRFSLKAIKELLQLPKAERLTRLATQKTVLQQQQAMLAATLAQLDATLLNQEGATLMTDKEKFNAFKEQAITENDRQFGAEVTAKYGVDEKRNADEHFRNLTEAQYEQLQNAEKQLKTALLAYLATPDLPSANAETAFKAHQTWLQTVSPKYNLAMHRGITDMYVADERFAAYYTKLTGDERAAAALRDIIYAYTAE